MSVTEENNNEVAENSSMPIDDKNEKTQAALEKYARPAGKGSKRKNKETSNEVIQERTINSILDNKNFYIGIGLSILLLVAGFAGFRSYQNGKIQDFDKSYVAFNNQNMEAFQNGNLEAQEFVTQAIASLGEHNGSAYTGKFTLEVSQALVQNGSNEENLSFLGQVKADLSSFPNPIGFFLQYSKIMSLEDLGRNEEALELLEGLASGSLMLDKVYFDLGRLYKKTGNLDKSKSSFEWVIQNHPESDHANYSRALM